MRKIKDNMIIRLPIHEAITFIFYLKIIENKKYIFFNENKLNQQDNIYLNNIKICISYI